MVGIIPYPPLLSLPSNRVLPQTMASEADGGVAIMITTTLFE